MEKDSEGETEGWSTESKWVYGNDVQSQEGDAEWPRWMSEDGDGNGNAEQRLIRTEPILDSFDVEAMEVPSAQKFNPKETLPDHRDQGAKWLGPEIGGTFALYSLICRYAKVSLLPNQEPSDAHISSFKLKLPTPELERSLRIKESLEKHSILKTLLLLLVLAGASMLIGDGILTPAISVMSAMSGLKEAVPGCGEAFTFLVFPCLLLAYMGQAAYLIKNPSMAERAFYASIPAGAFWPIFVIATIAAMIASQAMISASFSCIKQSMALGCFPRLKVIHTSRRFMGRIYIPIMNWFLMTFCVLITATCKSTSEMGNAYGIAEVSVMMVTTVLVTVVMLLIWQTNLFLALSFLVIFLSVELTYFCAVLTKVGDGSWLPLVFAFVILLVMYIWNYVSVLKYQSEVRKKISMDLMLQLGSNLGTVRVPGIGLVYNELVHGVPAIFGHFVTNLPAMHSTIIFVCIKYGYKDIRKENHQAFEQLLIESLEKFIRREAEELSLESDDDCNRESDDESKYPRSLGTSNGSIESLEAPLMANYKISMHYFAPSEPLPEASTSSGLPTSVMSIDEVASVEDELSSMHKAKEAGIVYLLGHGDVRARKDSWFIKKLVINYFYAFLRKNCRAGIATLSVPHTNLLQVGMTYMV